MRVEHMFSGRRCRNKALKQTLMSWGRRDFILANMAEGQRSQRKGRSRIWKHWWRGEDVKWDGRACLMRRYDS
jgi:hypothetical protein